MKDPNWHTVCRRTGCQICLSGLREMETGFLYYLRNRANAAESFSRTKTMSVRLIDISDDERGAFLQMLQRFPGRYTRYSSRTRLIMALTATGGAISICISFPSIMAGMNGRNAAMNPDKVYLTDEEYEDMAVAIRAAL